MYLRHSLLCLSASLLLLASCAAPTPPSSFPAVSSPSAPAQDAPLTAETLEGCAVSDLDAFLAADGPCALLLGQVPEAGLILYGLHPDLGGGVILRQGEDLFPFEQRFLPDESPRLPDLWWADFDGDGSSELAVNYLTLNTADQHIFELHLYRPEEGGWTDAALRAGDWEPALLDGVKYQFDPLSVAVALTAGESSLLYYLEDLPDPDPGQPLTFQGQTYFREENGRITAVFSIGLRLSGWEEPHYFARLLADVVYDGAALSLSGFVLESNYAA